MTLDIRLSLEGVYLQIIIQQQKLTWKQKKLQTNWLLIAARRIGESLKTNCMIPMQSAIEPYVTPEFPKETKGLKAITEKGKKFDAMVEKIHSVEASEPLIAGNSIAFTLRMDLTMKGKGRMNSPELCVYQVKDGKVISEEFFV